MIPYGRQNIIEEDINDVCETLRSDFLTQGPKVVEFEQAISEYCQVKHATAVNSATSALHLACLALGVESGDLVWTSPISFVASANCALHCNASVDFVDVDADSGLMSVKALEEKLAIAFANDRLPKVIIPVHFSGQSCDMHAISSLAKKYKIFVIEDACHALGAVYLENKVGNCQYSDICVFSFHPVKMITTGEGGVALTNNNIYYEKMTKLRSHGISKSVHFPPWTYEQHHLGYNYRMSDIAATLGLSQLKRLESFVTKRRYIATQYKEKLNNFRFKPILQCKQGESSFHLYPVLVTDSDTRRALYDYLHLNGIAAQVHYIPIYQQPYYKKMGHLPLPNSEKFYQRTISLPIFFDLTFNELDLVIKVLNDFEGA